MKERAFFVAETRRKSPEGGQNPETIISLPSWLSRRVYVPSSGYILFLARPRGGRENANG